MKSVVRVWNRVGVAQRIAYLTGAVLLLTGFAHLAGWLLMPEAALSGPVGFRKPMVFGFSAGLTLFSIGWLLTYFKERPRLHLWIVAIMAVVLVVEIVIIDLQRFRGVPSHFNMATPFDAFLWNVMGISILTFAVVAAVLMVLSFREMTGSPIVNLAIRLSLVLFFYSQVSGQFIVAHGLSQVVEDGVFIPQNMDRSTTVGEAGNLKLPHAISLHSIQALPLLGILLASGSLSMGLRRGLVWLAGIGFAGVTAVAQVQAFRGTRLFDTGFWSGFSLIACGLLFSIPFVVAILIRLANAAIGSKRLLRRSSV